MSGLHGSARGGAVARDGAVAAEGPGDASAPAWTLSVARQGGGETVLLRTLGRAGIPIQRVLWAGNRVLAVTSPQPWSRVEPAVRILEADWREPEVRRFQDGSRIAPPPRPR